MNEQAEQLFFTARNYCPFLRAFFKDFQPKQNIYRSVQIYFIQIYWHIIYMYFTCSDEHHNIYSTYWN